MLLLTEEIEDQKKRAKQKKLPYTYNRKCRELMKVMLQKILNQL